MNLLESYSIASPYNKQDLCAKFTILNTEDPFVINDVTSNGYVYTFSTWVKADSDGYITILDFNLPVSTSWQKHEISFEAEAEALKLFFDVDGTYYLYQTQLELGNKATDWSPSPEDVDDSIGAVQSTTEEAILSANSANERVSVAESLIQQLSNSISMLVVDENGGSLMTQTPEGGWTFSMADTSAAISSLSGLLNTLQEQTGNTQNTVDILNQTIIDHGATLEYVNITTYEDEPCIELGESDSEFKLLITNTRIMFMNGSNIPTYINTNGLVTQNIDVKGEIVQGGYVMLNTSDGGWGLLWKGVSS